MGNIKDKRPLYTFIVLIVLFVCLCGCEKHDNAIIDTPAEEESIPEDFDSMAYLKLELCYDNNETKSATSNDDYKTENGYSNENSISNIIAIFFPASDNNDLSEIKNNKINSWIEFSENDFDINGNVISVTKAIKGVSKRKHHVIVLTNYIKLKDILESGITVGDLLDMQESKLWKTGSDGMRTGFVMTNINNNIVDLGIPSSRENPLKINIRINRIASRIDIGTKVNEQTQLPNTYFLKSGNKNVASIKITAVKAGNILSQSSYLFKRGSSGENQPVSYFYDEIINKGYVLDPWSIYKTAEAINNGIVIDGVTHKVDYLYRNYLTKDFDFSGAANIPDEGELEDAEGLKYFILDYALENCSDFSDAKKAFSTALIYKAKLMPFGLFDYRSGVYDEFANNAGNYPDFYFNSTDNRICASLEALIYPFLRQEQGKDIFADRFTTESNWQDVVDYINTIKDNDVIGYKDYLLSVVDNAMNNSRKTSDKLTDSDIQRLTWIYFKNRVTEDKLKAYGTNFYRSGIMYYYYMIEHDKNSSLTMGNIKYAIVRNNIYRMTVQSINSIGEPKPYFPDDNPKEIPLLIHVSVLDWNIINHRDIIM